MSISRPRGANVPPWLYHGDTVERLSVKDRTSQARLNAVPAQERTFRDIMRRQTVQEQLMIFLMEQREETSLNMISTLGRGEIVNEPYILTPPSLLPSPLREARVLSGARRLQTDYPASAIAVLSRR